MASGPFNRGLLELLSSDTDTRDSTLKIILMAAGYVYNRDTQVFYSDVAANELTTAAGYTVGGATIAGKAFAQDNTNDRATFDANDPEWPAATFTTIGAILMRSTGTAATSPLLLWFDFGGAKVGNGNTFVAALDPLGLASITG